MINPTSSDAKELIALAERMGMPTADAVRLVLESLTDQELSEDEKVVDPGRFVRRMSA
jgi:hypothetical protein